MVGTGLKFESWKVRIHTENASQSHFYCFLKGIWIPKSGCSLESPTCALAWPTEVQSLVKTGKNWSGETNSSFKVTKPWEYSWLTIWAQLAQSVTGLSLSWPMCSAACSQSVHQGNHSICSVPENSASLTNVPMLTLAVLKHCSQCSHCSLRGFNSEAENVGCAIQSLISCQLLHPGPWNLVYMCQDILTISWVFTWAVTSHRISSFLLISEGSKNTSNSSSCQISSSFISSFRQIFFLCFMQLGLCQTLPCYSSCRESYLSSH